MKMLLQKLSKLLLDIKNILTPLKRHKKALRLLLTDEDLSYFLDRSKSNRLFIQNKFPTPEDIWKMYIIHSIGELLDTNNISKIKCVIAKRRKVKTITTELQNNLIIDYLWKHLKNADGLCITITEKSYEPSTWLILKADQLK